MSCCRKATIPPSALRAATSLYTREALLSAHSWFCRERGLPPTSPHVRGVGGEQCSPVQFGGHATLRGRAMLAPQISTYPMRADDQHRPLQNEGRDIWPRKGANGEGSKSVKKNAALLHFLAFGPFDHIIGVLRGEQPLSRGLRVAHERARFAGWRRSLCAAKRLPRNSETFFASFFGHKKGRSPGRSLLKKALPQGRQGR